MLCAAAAEYKERQSPTLMTPTIKRIYFRVSRDETPTSFPWLHMKRVGIMCLFSRTRLAQLQAFISTYYTHNLRIAICGPQAKTTNKCATSSFFDIGGATSGLCIYFDDTARLIDSVRGSSKLDFAFLALLIYSIAQWVCTQHPTH